MQNGPVTYELENINNINSHKLEIKPGDVIHAVSVALVINDCTGPHAESKGNCVYSISKFNKCYSGRKRTF